MSYKLDKEVKERITRLAATYCEGDSLGISLGVQQGIRDTLRALQGSISNEPLARQVNLLFEGKGGLNSAKPLELNDAEKKLFHDIWTHGSGMSKENSLQLNAWLKTGEVPEIRKVES